MAKHHINYGDGFTFIRTKKAYTEIQTYISSELTKIGNEIGLTIFPVYVELLWGDRYINEGKNLWETNRGN